MKATLSRIADLVDGRVVGDPAIEVQGISSPELAGPEELTFIVSHRHEHRLRDSKAGAVMVPEEEMGGRRPKIVVKNVYLAYAKVASFFHPTTPPRGGVSPEAWIHPEAQLGKDVTIYPFVWVGKGVCLGDRVTLHPMVCVGEESHIGEDSVLYPGVVVYPRCRIGKRVVIHGGTVIGSDGFGFARDGSRSVKIPQLGIVRIDDDVEIGANSAIDRASFGETRLHSGVKIDNLVQIGHNVEIGQDSILAGQVGLAGSVRLGRGVVLAGQVGVANHVVIGDSVMVGSKSGVAQDIPPGELMSGIPAIPHREWLRATKAFRRLPQLMRRLRELEKRLSQLERHGGHGEEGS